MHMVGCSALPFDIFAAPQLRSLHRAVQNPEDVLESIGNAGRHWSWLQHILLVILREHDDRCVCLLFPPQLFPHPCL